MPTRAAVSIQGLAKRYELGETLSSKTLRDALTASARRLLRRPQRSGKSSKAFWALKDVSFEIGQGEVLGIIGSNGAGKSTLLKILSGITEPTAGEIRVRGRVGALLEVGTGFHPELSGRENIFMNGAILGMRQAEIRRKFDEIVAFAGVDRFLDTPVKRYSSGMLIRLGFAVAAHLEPEILIIDEVLAVGDAAFQQKCLGKMEDVSKSGRTILFVSHNMAAIEALCDRAVCLAGGSVAFTGAPADVVTSYLAQQSGASGSSTSDSDGTFSLTVAPGSGGQSGVFRTGDDITILVSVAEERRPHTDLELVVAFNTLANERVMTLANAYQASRLMRISDLAAECRVHNCRLASGTYRVQLKVFDRHRQLIAQLDKARLTIVESDCHGTGKALPAKYGRVVADCAWLYHSANAGEQHGCDDETTVPSPVRA